MSKELSPAQLAELRALLLARRVDLLAQMEQNRENLVAPNPDEGAVMQRNVAREVDQTLTDIDAADLVRIDLALKLMDDDSYGKCGECGCAIPFERLKIEPQTQHCVACKSRFESKHATR